MFALIMHGVVLWSSQESPASNDSDDDMWYGVFLGGTCATSTWRQDITIPLLK